MEQIIFNDEELLEMKQRILARAEERISNELVNQMRQQVVRDALRDVRNQVTKRVEELVLAALTNERVEALVASVLEEKTSKQWGRSEIERELDNAIMRVTQAHAEAISGELKNLLYLRLKEGFYEKEKSDG